MPLAMTGCMRWVKEGLVLLMWMSSSTVGCATSTVMQAGADNPRAFAALPFALVGDLIAAAASGGSSASAPPDPSLLSWEDPDDWIAECEGPSLCHAPESFVCYGEPDDCHCACSMNVASTRGMVATASAQ